MTILDDEYDFYETYCQVLYKYDLIKLSSLSEIYTMSQADIARNFYMCEINRASIEAIVSNLHLDIIYLPNVNKEDTMIEIANLKMAVCYINSYKLLVMGELFRQIGIDIDSEDEVNE